MFRARHLWLGAGAAAGTLHVVSTKRSSRCQSSPRTFRFGVIADIQYCDCDDASNFAGTEVRKYRGTLAQAHQAAEHWNAAGVNFAVQLGDLIDGQNAGGYGAGLSFAEPQSETALGRVVAALAKCHAPMYHAIGNHELYNFNWDGLAERLQQPKAGAAGGRNWHVASAERLQRSPAAGAQNFYFSWQPAKGWTFVMLNAYAVSIEQDKSEAGYREACDVLCERNPQCYEAITTGKKQGINFFAGLERDEELRYVPFNGGLGVSQLKWLREEVRAAAGRGDRVVVMSHVPLLPEASSHRTLVYDSEAALQIMREEGRGSVVAVLAGHLHRGGYARDSSGIHHVTLQSPLNFERCFGYIDAFEDRLELVGCGDQGIPSRTLHFAEEAKAA